MTSKNSQAATAALSHSLRARRQQQGLSLAALASRAEVSRSMLIQIEQGRTNPSLGVLVRIAGALGVSLTELLDLEPPVPVSVMAPEIGAVLWNGEDGGQGRMLAGSGQLQVWDWRMNPTEGFTARPQSRGTVEIIHVLDGHLTLQVGGETHEVTTGGTVIFRPDRPHGYANHSPEPLRMIISNSEPPGEYGLAKEILNDTP